MPAGLQRRLLGHNGSEGEARHGLRTISLDAARGLLAGPRCWILGSGPSLDMHDLSRLAGEIVIACNAAIVAALGTGAELIWHFHDGRALREVGPRLKAWRTWVVAAREESEKPIVAALQGRNGALIRYHRSRLVHRRTCMETAIQIAQELGFERAYLLGADRRSWNDEVYAKSLRWKHCWFRDPSGRAGEENAFREMSYALSLLAKTLRIRVYDCSPISSGEVFYRAVYDDVLDAAAGKPRLVL